MEVPSRQPMIILMFYALFQITTGTRAPQWIYRVLLLNSRNVYQNLSTMTCPMWEGLFDTDIDIHAILNRMRGLFLKKEPSWEELHRA